MVAPKFYRSFEYFPALSVQLGTTHMELDGSIVSLLTAYQLPAIFVGAFFFGEAVIITASFLAAQGFWSVANVFWLAFAGTVLSDALWFIFGRRVLVHLHRWEKYQMQSEKILASLHRWTGGRPFLVLLFVKFLYGTRILTILFLSAHKMRFLTFVFFDAIGTVVWLAVIISIGWLAGRSLVDLAPYLNKFEFVAVFLLLIILAIRLFTTWLSKKLTKE